MKKKVLSCLLALSMSAALLAGCGSSSSDSKSSDDSKKTEEKADTTKALSATDYNFEPDYYFNTFNTNSLKDKPRQGIKTFKSADEVVYEDITYDELIDLFQKEGTYMIALCGSWCHNTRAMTPSLTKYAKENGIDTIYTYDFNLDDNENGNTFIRMSDGSENAGVNYNYMYGEVVKQYLTNIDDWIEFPSTTERAISYTNAKGETETVGRIQQPIAFIYNKDNTTNYSDKEDNADKYPVMYAFEQMVERDKDGVYTKEYDEEGNEVTDKNGDPVKHYCTKKYNAEMKKMFDFVNDNNIEFTEYSKEDFVRENYPTLKDAEKVNIKTVTYRQFAWLLQQDGNAIYMVGGPYDEATQNEIADVNAKAVENDVNVYLWDPYVDGKISEDDWGYKNTGDIMKSDSINFMYTTLIENSLTNLTTEEFENGADGASLTYKNDAGEEKTVPVIKSPFVFSFNKDATDEDGISAPITAYSEKADTLDAVFSAYADGIAK